MTRYHSVRGGEDWIVPLLVVLSVIVAISAWGWPTFLTVVLLFLFGPAALLVVFYAVILLFVWARARGRVRRG